MMPGMVLGIGPVGGFASAHAIPIYGTLMGAA